jgi:hypothetical protein
MRMHGKAATMLATVALTVVALTGVASASPPPANSPWLQSNYNAAKSRANLSETTLTTSTISGVALRRSITAAPNPDSQCAGFEGVVTPIVSDGFAFGVFNGYLQKVNVANGAVVWRIAPDTTFSTRFRSIAVSGSLVLLSGVGCDSVSDPNGFIATYQVSSGTLVWSGTTPPVNPLFDMVVASGFAVVTGETIGSGAAIAVVSVSTGAVAWSDNTDACTVPVQAVVVGGLVVYNFCDFSGNNFLRGAALSTGATVWTKSGAWQPLAGDRATSVGHHVYATDTSTGKIYDLNPANGVSRTRVAGAKAVLAVDGSRIYTTCGSATGQVCGYALSTGLRQWNVTTGAAVSLAAFAGGVLYLSNGKALRASSGATLKALWSGQATSLVVGDGRICAVVNAQKLNVYGLSNA